MKIVPVVLLVAFLRLSRGRNFRIILDCFGRRGCPLDTASISISSFADTPMWSTIEDKESIPVIALCAHLCHRNITCLGFKYEGKGDTCSLYTERVFKIWVLDECTSFEVERQITVSSNETAMQNLAFKRRTCQSSAAVVKGQVQGAWNLVDGKLQNDLDSYAMTDVSDQRGWWQIDLEWVTDVTFVQIVIRNVSTLSSFPRLVNLTIEVTNTSMTVRDPHIDNSCATVRRKLVTPGMAMAGACPPSLLPGRYLLIREHPTMQPSASDEFSLAEVYVLGI